ncbi:MAG: DUF2029 domain-containing protein [Vicinamibacteria bacterium]|nr:DUF2029 domain-containing protein [Vicinamibacteria bacterium]
MAVFVLFSHYYSRTTGFTALIQFSKNGHSRELPIVQQIPHYDHKGKAAYDGQYYAQMAIEPLLTTPAIDRVMDNPPYRARRILASWTAYLAGLGNPARVLYAYAAQTFVIVILLAVLLSRTFPLSDWRSTAAWTACLLTPGLMTSVRFALPDALGATLTVAAVLAVQSRRVWLAACLIGLASLARETFLLAVPILWIAPDRRIVRSMAATLLAVAPLLLWQDYLYSIYRGGGLTAGGHIGNSGSAYLRDVRMIVRDVSSRWGRAERAAAFVSVSMLVQMIFVLTRFNWRSAWWWCGSATGGLMLVVTPGIWVGSPRVFLPLAFAFNALLPRNSRWFWILFMAGNLFVLVTIDILVVPWWRAWR